MHSARAHSASQTRVNALSGARRNDGKNIASMTTWREFWDSAHSIYVSERNKDVHYRDVAEQVVAFVPHPGARVLDLGCCEAIHADLVANVAREVVLCDAAPSVGAAIAARFPAKT